MAMSKCSCWGLLTWCWGAVGIERECEMSFREERFCYWLESFTWGYGRLLCPLAARDLLVVVEVDIGGHPATESQGGNIAENHGQSLISAVSSHSKIQLHILNLFLSISSQLPRTGDINMIINVWSPPSLGGSSRLQWWRLDMTTQSVIHNIHSLLSSLSAQSAITAPGRRHVSGVSLCLLDKTKGGY